MSHANGNGTKARALREQILSNARNSRSERVQLKALGVEVEIRALKAREALDIRAAARNEDGSADEGRLHGASIIAAVFEPETGEPVFGAADRDTILDMLGLAAFQELALEVTRVSGLPSAANDAVIAKNLKTPTSDTPSVSPNASA